MTRKERKQRMRERRKENLRLTDKKHPLQAIIATGFAGLSVVILVVSCILSSRENGQAGLSVGFMGIAALIVSAAGFTMAAKSLKQDEIRYVFPTVASVANGLLLIFYIILYFFGIYA